MILGRPAEVWLCSFQFLSRTVKANTEKLVFFSDFQGPFSPPMTENDEAKPSTAGL
jgi:hypothetical protein